MSKVVRFAVISLISGQFDDAEPSNEVWVPITKLIDGEALKTIIASEKQAQLNTVSSDSELLGVPDFPSFGNWGEHTVVVSGYSDTVDLNAKDMAEEHVAVLNTKRTDGCYPWVLGIPVHNIKLIRLEVLEAK